MSVVFTKIFSPKFRQFSCVLCAHHDRNAVKNVTKYSVANVMKNTSTFVTNKKFEDTLGVIFDKWQKKFKESGISEPKESAELILAHFLKSKKISDVYRNLAKKLDHRNLAEIESLCKKRLRRIPVQYIIEEWDFRDLTLKMSPPVFIPRPETEELVDLALREIDSKNSTEVLELCAGSGAICISLLKSRPQMRVTAVEKSEKACELIMENARKYGLSGRLTIVQSKISEKNLLDFIDDTFDVIVSNPPYVPTKNMENLQPEILLYEDLEALDGGDDGLNVISPILTISSRILNQNGALLMEVDPTHPQLLKNKLAEEHPRLSLSDVYKDFCSKERFVKIIKG